jgi:peptidoglycan pentaglycine glycine transferase (the first glycine)
MFSMCIVTQFSKYGRGCERQIGYTTGNVSGKTRFCAASCHARQASTRTCALARRVKKRDPLVAVAAYEPDQRIRRRGLSIILIRDTQHWDQLITAHTHGGFMQSAGWGIFKRHFGWAPFRVLVPLASRDLPALAQVLFRRLPYSPYTIGYLPRGPLLNYQSDDNLVEMIRALDALAARVHAVAISWEPPIARDAALTARLSRHGLKPAPSVQHTATRVIDLTPSLDLIQASWEPKWRYNTRLAAKRGVRVRAANGIEDFERWYAMFRATSQRDNFTIRGPEYYRSFWQQQYCAGDTVLFLAEHERSLLAGILVHRFGREATYLFGASSNEGRNMMPNHALQWSAMQWAKERGASRYDMFGIADTNADDDPLAGVSRFKAGFGGSTIQYAGGFERIYHPLLHQVVKRARAGGLS